jgi:hypothetical protein
LCGYGPIARSIDDLTLDGLRCPPDHSPAA